MQIDGGCHCGHLRYEAVVEPGKVMICHCTDCQVLSGTAFRTVVPVAESEFHMLGGEPTIYLKTAQSGRPREQAFCPRCGSQIYATSAGAGPRVIGIRVGTIRQRAELPPRLETWCQSAMGWLPENPATRRHERQSEG